MVVEPGQMDHDAAHQLERPHVTQHAGSGARRAKRLSDAEIKRLLIEESISDYPGNCPCPYNTARNGSSCGRRSAYSRPGGAAPLCYPSDVTDEMVATYRADHASP